MLRLPQFGVDSPETIEGVVAALGQPGARLVAGGTDILPNLKHWLDQPPLLVSLARVRGLRSIEPSESADALRIGAGMTLTEVSEHEEVRANFPSLAKAAGTVASPLIRNMGTLGGNVNLDTRCRYVNQTEFWRGAIGGGCIKSEGDVCHVVPKGRNCVAAMSSDCVPVLISLDAVIELVGPKGRREMPMAEYYRADGTNHTLAESGELTVAIRIPMPASRRKTDYVKWTVRKSIDFPLISLALRFDLDDDGHTIAGVRIVAGVLGAKPRIVSKLDDLVGKRIDDPTVAHQVAVTVHKQCKPLENVPYEAPYRRQMLQVLTRRCVASLCH